MASSASAPKGGSWLIEAASEAVTPEDFQDIHLAMRDSVASFMAAEVAPKAEAIEEHDLPALRQLVRRAGEVGFLGVEIPEDLGGLGLDLICSALCFEAVGAGGSGSFATTIGAHTGIGTWPVMYFGSDEQRRKFLPKLASGEWVAAYALTEPGSGSDALAAKCRASLSPDGRHWVVSGEKTFITNAGFADVFTVFVKIDGDDAKKACLIVERGTPGFSVGKEERKLGIRGSSTCSLFFEDALVPVGNLLGEIGKGHKIVLNTLNLGRFKLGAAAVGGLKASVDAAVRYAADRKQFGRPILDNDAIRAKIADMAVAAWVGESMVYRTAGLLSGALEGVAPGDAAVKAIEEYAIECSIVKVALSEMLGAAVDEAVQVHGGYGFIEEYPVARAYRDSRINRIFEGTNEINRMLAVGELLKRGMKGKIDLMGAMADVETAVEGTMLERSLERAKKAALFVLGQAVQTHMMALEREQQVLTELADMLGAVYAMESSLLRLRKLERSAAADLPLSSAVVALCFHDGLARIERGCELVLASLPGGQPGKALGIVGRIPGSADVIGLRRRIAGAAAVKSGYPF